MRKIGIPKWLKITGSVTLVLWGLALAFYYLFPLKIAEWSNRWDFWREGVQEIRSAGLHGYVQDHCSDAKECTCVAMVHGLADSAMTWKKILLWPSNGWKDSLKLYAFDLPGTDSSPAPLDPLQGYRVRNQAHALQDALAPLCSKWILVGNSLGGWIALWMALDWKANVSKVILLDSAGLKSGEDPSVVEAFLNPSVESLKSFQKRAYYRGRPLPENVWRAAAERMRVSNARAVLQAQTPEDYLEDKVPTLRKPVLILWGAEDHLLSPSEGKKLKSLIPGSIWRELPECGHVPQKECPLEVIRAIEDMVSFGGV